MKKTSLKISSAILLASVLMPLVSFADTTGGAVTPVLTATNPKSTFCKNIDSFITKTDNKLGQKDSMYESKKADQAEKVAQNQADHDGKLEKNRGVWSAKRDIEYSKLSKKAKTDAEKQAVATFQTAMTNAIKARQDAIDSAIDTYRTGLNKIIATRKTVVDTALATLKTETDAVLAKAKADCGSSVDSKIVKTQTMAGLKTAQDKFKASLKDTAQMKADLKILSDSKKTAFDKAMADFKTATDAARKALKAAFA